MTSRLSLFVILISLGFLSACGGISFESPLSTLIPTEHIPTAIALTVEALEVSNGSPTPGTASSGITGSPTPTSMGASLSPTSTRIPDGGGLATQENQGENGATPTQSAEASFTSPTPIPSQTPLPVGGIPYATLQIIRPGPLSKLVSPIELHAFVRAGAGGRVRVELLGEDGRPLYRQVFVFDVSPRAQVNLINEIEYEVAGVAETARLVISTEDAYGRPLALTSEDLILLSMGENDLNPPGDLLETIVIQQPTSKQLIQGEKLIVSGLARTSGDRMLLVELVAPDGRVVGSRLAEITPSPDGGHSTFAAEVPYDVSAPTWVRLVVSERGERLPGVVNLSSVEVLLSP